MPKRRFSGTPQSHDFNVEDQHRAFEAKQGLFRSAVRVGDCREALRLVGMLGYELGGFYRDSVNSSNPRRNETRYREMERGFDLAQTQFMRRCTRTRPEPKAVTARIKSLFRGK